VSEKGRPILCLEAGQENRVRLEALCEQHGYVLESASTVEAATTALQDMQHLVVLLEVSPGPLNGFDACRELRACGFTVPILVVSRLHDAVDAVVAFELGADDFVRIPYEPREILARIDAHVRRQHRGERDIVHGPLRINAGRRAVWRDGTEIALTRTEFDLLMALARRAERPVSRDELIRETGMHLDVDTRTVDAHIHRLRRKLEPNAERPTFIQSVTGQGYRLVAPRTRLAGAA
jgi:DNA-binding response OmpR family regulator